jgi:hypothetical protein
VEAEEGGMNMDKERIADRKEMLHDLEAAVAQYQGADGLATFHKSDLWKWNRRAKSARTEKTRRGK